MPAAAKRKRPPELARPGSRAGRSATRARITSAMRALACEQGHSGATVTALIARARVSSKTFYEHFDDAEDCFTATFEEALRELRKVAMPVYQQPGPWPERVRGALHALLAHLDQDRELACFMFLEAPKAGPAVQERRRQIWELLTIMLDGARSGQSTAAPPIVIDEVLVQGAISVIRARLLSREHAPLVELTNQLMAAIAHSYLGPDAAGLELSRPTPSAPARAKGALARLPVRLTHRTIRVIAAIAEQPGASNREVGQAAGISDAGQISRLLGRLQALELIRNDGRKDSSTRNLWHLTPLGEQVAHSMRHELGTVGD